MRITILGTGNMARGVAARALAGGHAVTFVGTALGKAEDLAEEMTGMGSVTAAEQVEGDLVVLAVPYTQGPHAIRQHADELGGAAVVDISNPVDLTTLEPIPVELGSAAEVIASVVPGGVPVVKAFNTAFAGTLVAGEVAGQPLDIFLAGDDEDSKQKVSRLIADGGMRPVDAGALVRARELEATGYLHMAVQPALGTRFASALKVVG
jgi:hypothetical protein